MLNKTIYLLLNFLGMPHSTHLCAGRDFHHLLFAVYSFYSFYSFFFLCKLIPLQCVK